MVAKIFGAALQGVVAVLITLEVSVGQGLHTFLVGLPDNVVKESLMRIEIAIKSCGLHMPRTKIVINLAPADLQKTGAAFDLPLALGILALPNRLKIRIF
jgi:magnesium chelatase family protein